MMDSRLVQENAYSNIKCAVVDKNMRVEEKKSRIGQVKEGEFNRVLHIDRGLL